MKKKLYGELHRGFRPLVHVYYRLKQKILFHFGSEEPHEDDGEMNLITPPQTQELTFVIWRSEAEDPTSRSR